MTLSSQTKTIAIVGGGLSGALVAANLIRGANTPLRIHLIERRPPIGPGVAYASTCPNHLLNVPAGRMGLWPEEPDHFLQWLRQHRGEAGIPDSVDAGDYLPRQLYGRYIMGVLTEVKAAARALVEYEEMGGEVIDLEESERGAVLKLSDGRTLAADRVVLAVGNLPGEYPIHRALPVYRHPRYVHIPWRGNALDDIAPEDDVLLVGQGLTATDIMIQLDARGHRGTIHALSRNGLQPQPQKTVTAQGSFLDREPRPPTLRALVRRVRREVAAAAAQGIDWRVVIDGLRPHAPKLWQGFTMDERAQFMKYLRPFWEIHRHRVAPQVAATVARMAEEGRVKFYAGRLQVLEADRTGVQALFRRRGTIQHVSLHVAKVINCTGPRTDYSKYQHPLFIHLLARGLIDHDALALGINALPTGEVLRYRGAPVGWLYTLGAPLKGVLWESTAVPEIRVQALRLAQRLLEA